MLLCAAWVNVEIGALCDRLRAEVEYAFVLPWLKLPSCWLLLVSELVNDVGDIGVVEVEGSKNRS
jgi:hypothetical protein